MNIDKETLLTALKRVKPGLSKKEFVEQATHFIFSDNEVVTFSDSICIMHPLLCDFDFSVKGEEFYKIIDSIKESTIDFSIKDSTLKIKTKQTKAGLALFLGEESKIKPLINSIKQNISEPDFWKKLPKDFLVGTALCAFSASKDLSTGVRACVAIKNDSVYSTDNIRASLYVMESSMDSIILIARDVAELQKYNIVEYGVSESWAHFKTEDGIIFSCKLMIGEYPYENIESIFIDQDAVFSYPPEFKDMVESVILLTEGDVDINRFVTITIGDNKLSVKASQERNWIEKSIDFSYESEPFSFIINPIFLGNVLNVATAFAKNEKLAQFTAPNFYHVLSLPKQK